MGKSIHIEKTNKESLLDGGKEVGLQVNAKKNK